KQRGGELGGFASQSRAAAQIDQQRAQLGELGDVADRLQHVGPGRARLVAARLEPNGPAPALAVAELPAGTASQRLRAPCRRTDRVKRRRGRVRTSGGV